MDVERNANKQRETLMQGNEMTIVYKVYTRDNDFLGGMKYLGNVVIDDKNKKVDDIAAKRWPNIKLEIRQCA